MDARTHVYRLKVLEQHLDTFGHMNNATYLTILEEARWDWIESNGYGLNKIIETQMGPTILEVNLRFKRELTLRQDIKIETKCTEVRKKIMYVEQKIINDKNEVCTEAKFTLAFFDMKNRRVIEPTEEWLKAININS